MESILVTIFGASIVGALIFIVPIIIAITVYLATKHAFVPAITLLRQQEVTKEQTYALYAAGAILGFFAYILYVVIAVAAYVYFAFAKKQ
jgi:hypothetical protein